MTSTDLLHNNLDDTEFACGEREEKDSVAEQRRGEVENEEKRYAKDRRSGVTDLLPPLLFI